ncbi:double-strand break repair protein AddB [Bosea sp. (in: a-proteobacteria)]|uniref:double-strand break repair protein AddB n=1 Tax=Bosea sp. (in: a-proteobacteria) TaxID=1871050 RepID=UPI002FCB8FE4
MAALKLFSIPAGAPFLDVLAQALLAGRFGKAFDPDDPAALSRTTLYLPTQRAARALAAILSEKLGGRALLLPRIVPLGDVDEAETALIAGAGAELARLAPIEPLRRRFVLTQLIAQWGKAANRRHLRLDPAEPALVPATLAEAWGLAGDLAALLDQMQTEGVAPQRLKGLDAARFDEIWQFNARFLDIVAETWPAILAERGECDPAEFRNRMLEAERQRLSAGGLSGPVIAAGSTGTVPATARLLAAIARLPNGAVVLPDLDETLPEPAWKAIASEPAPSHPQAALHHLLEVTGAGRDEVETLAPPAAGLAVRRDLLRQAMLPASVTDGWAGLAAAPGAAGALVGLRVVEAADEREEALVAALALREALERPGERAALITPDRGLAERVAVELRRWGIVADDSAGLPLGRWPAGALLRLVLDAVASELAPASLVALLSHPLCRLGLPEAILRQGAATLEIGTWRGETVGKGFAGLRRAFVAIQDRIDAKHAPRPRRRLTPEDRAAAEQVLAGLEEALSPLIAALARPDPVAVALAEAARHAVMLLGSDENGAALAFHGPDGEALSTLFDEIEAAAPDAPREGRARDWIAILTGLIDARAVTRREPGHPRLKIWGLLEARLLEAEHVVLGGLIEGAWPPATQTDSFLNRPMRAELGLSSPERRIGQTAHDFVQAAMAGSVTLTRARKAGEAETIPSRFWQRLKAVSPKDAWQAAEARGQELSDWAALLSARANAVPASRPKPVPAPHLHPQRLSVTEVETLYRDPYALFARKILKLDVLPEMVEDPSAADRGSLLHDIVAQFAQTYPEQMPAGAAGSLVEIGENLFRAYDETPEVRAFWWPRFLLIVQNFIDWEGRRRPELARVAVEQETLGEFALPGGGSVLLTGRADRIEVTRTGTLRIIDFKTGAAPSEEQVRLGFAPQLTLEAELAQRHGFPPGILPAPVEALLYLKLGHDPKSWQKDKKLGFKEEEQADVTARHLAHLLGHLAVLRAGKEPYLSRRAPAYIKYASPYDQLARVKEWSAAPGLGLEAGDEA